MNNQKGFTLIELLVVVAIIALIASVALVSTLEHKRKARDVRRLGDMTAVANGLELFNTQNRGYPADINTDGVPDGIIPKVMAKFPVSPVPPDSSCEGVNHPLPIPANTSSNQYYYVPSGTPFSVGAAQLYPDYSLYFCLGRKTGDYQGGPHRLTPKGIR